MSVRGDRARALDPGSRAESCESVFPADTDICSSTGDMRSVGASVGKHKSKRVASTTDVSAIDEEVTVTAVSDIVSETEISAGRKKLKGSKKAVQKKSGRNSDTDSDVVAGKEKRVKLGSPGARRANVAAAVNADRMAAATSETQDVFSTVWGLDVSGCGGGVAAVAETRVAGVPRGSKGSSKSMGADAMKAAVDPVAELKAITGDLMDAILADSVERSVVRAVSTISARYELLLMRLVAENERMRGRLDAGVGSGPIVAPVAVAAASARRGVRAGTSGAPEKFPLLPKPVETWSVVVKGRDAATSKEVVEKVVREVAPTLGVRVHGVRPMKAGGAVIRTPSVAEREQIRSNRKFAEVGLDVSVNDKIGQKVVVQRVHAEISPDEFMEGLYESNLGDMMPVAQFRRNVRLVSAPWRVKDGEVVNVTLECTKRVVDRLISTGAYIKWFRFRVREQEIVQTCFRCLGFNHWVQECRMKEETCRRCGVVGHRASACRSEVRCRDCEFKGFPADHRMLSVACPVYGAMVARVNSRH